MILMADIIAHASRVFGIPAVQITGPARCKDRCRARFAVCKLAYEMTRLTYTQIGLRLGGRDHSSIINLHHNADKRMQRNPKIWRVYSMLKGGE